MLEAAPDFSFDVLLAEFWQDAGLTRDVLSLDTESARNAVGTSIRGRKIIAAHYQHVDGTSFAAPITASVIAQMLEANPLLSPAAIKHILITTAERIRSDRAIRQGYGVLNAKRAVELAASEKHTGDNKGFKAPVRIGEMVEFTFHDDHASSVNLVGDFNEWNRGSVPLKRTSNGIWTTSIQINGTQRLRYKLLIDNERWTEDPTHGMKEEDGFGGFHSVLEI
jgi:serine protease AprX